MPTFNLSWTAPVNTTGSVLSQRAEHRRKTPQGIFSDVGFTNLPNPLSSSAVATTSPNLLANVIYQFRVLAICAAGVEMVNSNGIIDAIKFVCPTTTETHTDQSITVTVGGLPADIGKVIFNRGAGNVIVNTSGGSASTTFPGLAPSIAYTITTELVATLVNGADLTSTLGCSIIVTTNPASACTAPQGLTVSAGAGV